MAGSYGRPMLNDVTPRTADDDGRADFDFLMGTWRITNRKLVDPLRPDSSEWTEFTTVAVARPLLGGLGNTDSYEGTGDVPFDGFTVRLFDPASRTWRIWWASTRNPGHLDPPLEGRFVGGHGVFHGTDTVGGADVHVRFDWHVEQPDRPRWTQSFSRDGGDTWSANFTMEFERADDIA